MRFPRTLILPDQAIAGSSSERVIVFSFDFSSVFPYTIREMQPGEIILAAFIEIEEVFAGGFSLSVGFTVDNEKLLRKSNINPQKVGGYGGMLLYPSLGSETLTLYKTGASLIGKGFGVVELIK